MESVSLKDKVPPYNEDAESAVLGALLINFNLDALDIVRMYLGVGDFFRTGNQHIFNAIEQLEKKGSGVDLLTLIEELKSEALLERAGGAAYVSGLTSSVPTTANIEYYSKIVRECSIRRRLLTISAEIHAQAHDESKDTSEILEEVERQVFDINDQRSVDSIQSAGDVIKEAIFAIEQRYSQKGDFTGVPSGFDDLDAMTTGFQKSEMIVIGARPSVGKTAFALTVAANIAIKQKINCGFFTLEMTTLSVMQRLLSLQANINSNKIRTGLLKPSDFNSLTDAASSIYDAPLWIDDTPNMKLLDLRAQARRMVSKFDVKIIFVDYLGLITFEDKRIPRHEQMAEVSRSLKALARELDIPIVALSQVGRQTEGKAPGLADLRESGAIEQDADVVMFLHRERGIDSHEGTPENIETELIIAKQRNGPVGVVKMAFIPHFTKFVPLAHSN
ncbi:MULTISPECIES: replicative DNA helicase [unclassified Oceanispirochaeta]|uniref:replicative DNA helicase n=1 Tax=unclassified Oceanispirochaeta TaxID=2635722 RepID=UPI000E096319|nr:MULTISPECIES: replicative DNA helicase [unclassified Oceanispirochaeta]MBF9017211.1 replicative DNA helicase [Oceanispirochaeta sp. M2]NPD73660.1 replicative DNA helicase [Oceanispirochaeta sp. M1]RDG30590.1 replicative DNA helicase [Oceanispirochaeta sp. M1]